MKPYEITAWPTEDLRIETHKVDRATGTVLRKRETKYKRTKAWWRARGFSFNGRITAHAK